MKKFNNFVNENKQPNYTEMCDLWEEISGNSLGLSAWFVMTLDPTLCKNIPINIKEDELSQIVIFDFSTEVGKTDYVLSHDYGLDDTDSIEIGNEDTIDFSDKDRVFNTIKNYVNNPVAWKNYIINKKANKFNI
jgi:hypothetical protein